MNENTSLLKLFISECIGTALLLLLGLSCVIFMFGKNSFIAEIIPNVTVRKVMTSFIFGSIGASIAISTIGKISGAHINPAVSFVFYLFGKIELKTAGVYMLAQCVGAVIGTLPLLAWGNMGESVQFGATVPGEGFSMFAALLGEIITTCAMVTLLILFLGFRETRRYTP